jgi:hypothetical protein
MLIYVRLGLGSGEPRFKCKYMLVGLHPVFYDTFYFETAELRSISAMYFCASNGAILGHSAGK